MVGLVKNNFMQLSLTWICERNTETFKWSYFALHYWAPKQKIKQKQKKQTNKPTDKLLQWNIFQWRSHLVENDQGIFEATLDKLFNEVLVKYSFQNNTKYVWLMWFCVLASEGGKIPGLKGFYETGRQRIPTACWCHYVLRSTCACVGRDLAALTKYLKYNYIPQPQSSVGVLDKLYSITYDKFLFASHLEVSSHFSLTSSKYFAPTRLEEELGKSLMNKGVSF